MNMIVGTSHSDVRTAEWQSRSGESRLWNFPPTDLPPTRRVVLGTRIPSRTTKYATTLKFDIVYITMTGNGFTQHVLNTNFVQLLYVHMIEIMTLNMVLISHLLKALVPNCRDQTRKAA